MTNEVGYVERGETYTPPPPTQPPVAPEPPALDGRDEPLPARPEPRFRLGPRSLTARLVSGVVALVFVVVAVVGSGTYVALRSSLNGRLDQQVQLAANRTTNFFEGCESEVNSSKLRCPIASGPESNREWVALLFPNGNVAGVINSGPIYNLHLTASQRHRFAVAPGSFQTVRNGSDEIRVTARLSNGLLVATGLSTGERDGTLSKLIGLELLIGGAALVVAFVATLGGVRFSLRRLRAVTTTAQDVASELSPEGAGLDRRVHDTDDTTEVGQLATSFNTMLGAVETQFAARLDSERRMRQFLADASHELRTPLTSIRGYAELARMQRAAGDTSADNLDRIESEGTRMSRLVEDLLTLARGDAEDREPQRELIEVSGLMDDAASGSRAAFPSRRIDVQIDSAPLVIGDRDQLLRVVRNLVTNAAIHTAPERPIMVRAFGDAADVTIQVIDGGPGLAPEDAAHVFERFWRADKARTRARGGSGLGLSIVATIVRAHGGTVRFDSSVEAGSTVTVVLPAAHQSAD